AAAALARAHGVSQAAVRDGLRGFRPDGHRIAPVAERDGIRWVDDSKATNPHAAQASLLAFDPVVWVAGGRAKGATFDPLGQTVLLAPGCASQDLFTDYAARGDAFAAAVRELLDE